MKHSKLQVDENILGKGLTPTFDLKTENDTKKEIQNKNRDMVLSGILMLIYCYPSTNGRPVTDTGRPQQACASVWT